MRLEKAKINIQEEENFLIHSFSFFSFRSVFISVGVCLPIFLSQSFLFFLFHSLLCVISIEQQTKIYIQFIYIIISRKKWYKMKYNIKNPWENLLPLMENSEKNKKKTFFIFFLVGGWWCCVSVAINFPNTNCLKHIFQSKYIIYRDICILQISGQNFSIHFSVA